MGIKLDQRLVRDLRPDGEKRCRVADSVVQGLHMEVLPPTKEDAPPRKVWRLRFRTESGDRKWFTVGTWPAVSVDDARSEARKLIGKIEGGEDPSAKRTALKQAPTISNIWAQFLELHGPHLTASTIKGYKDQFRAHIEPAFGSEKIQNLNREDIARWHHKASQKAPTSANYSLRVLATLLARAEEWGYIPLGSNPARLVKQNPHRIKHRPLSVEELHKVGTLITEMENKKQIGAAVAAILRLLLLTGCRRNEIVTLKWKDVDQEAGCIVLKDHKTAKHMGERRVYLGPAGVKILSGVAGKKLGTYVFPNAEGTSHISPMKVYLGWKAVREAAEITDARLHDLRHSLGAKAGATLPAFMVQTILGHRQPSTTSRYATPLNVAVEEAVHRLQEDVATALGL